MLEVASYPITFGKMMDCPKVKLGILLDKLHTQFLFAIYKVLYIEISNWKTFSLTQRPEIE